MLTECRWNALKDAGANWHFHIPASSRFTRYGLLLCPGRPVTRWPVCCICRVNCPASIMIYRKMSNIQSRYINCRLHKQRAYGLRPCVLGNISSAILLRNVLLNTIEKSHGMIPLTNSAEIEFASRVDSLYVAPSYSNTWSPDWRQEFRLHISFYAHL